LATSLVLLFLDDIKNSDVYRIAAGPAPVDAHSLQASLPGANPDGLYKVENKETEKASQSRLPRPPKS
jgi:hypothetical protein